MIKRSGFLVFISFALSILALSGCQSLLQRFPFLTQTSTPEPLPEVTTVPTSGPGVPPSSPPSPVQINQLSIWIPPQFDPYNGTPAGELLKAQIEKYSTDNPGITVNVRIKAEIGSGGLLDSLTTASSAAPSVLPGIILLSRTDLESAAQNGLLFPVESSDYGFNEGDLFEYARDLANAKGNRYGIPFSGDVLMLAYKPLQIGYPPLFWRDIMQQQSIIAWPAADPRGLIQISQYLESGGNFGGDSDDVLLQEIPLQKSLQFISDGATANIFPYWLTEYASFGQCWQALQDSRSSYAIIWASQYLVETPENIAITVLPATQDRSVSLADGWILAFPQTTQERYQAHLPLAKYLLDPAFQQTWSEAAGVLPVSKTVLAGWSDQGLSGILSPAAESARLIPTNNIIQTLGPLFSNATQELIRQQVSFIQASNTILKELTE